MRPVRAITALLFAAPLAFGALAAEPVAAKSRIKDIVEFEGVRENMLVGYGIVVGLNGTGDALRNAPFTKQSLEAMLERLGVNTRDAQLNTKNVAAVMVTAKLPPFAAPGSQIDVSVSALGDAKSLQGGSLLVTPLLGADGRAYALAQGTVQTGSISASGASGSSVSKGVPTAGRIAGGASVELETGFQLASMGQMRMTLRNPDFTTARRIAEVINQRYPGAAIAENPTIVTVRPSGGDMMGFLAQVENLAVEPDAPAKVVIDEVAGVIVMGEAVRVSTVAIQQGNLTITVREQPAVSQPAPFARTGETAVVPQTDISVDEERGRQFLTVKSGASLATLVAGLNALGVTPRDMISILQTIRAAGALQAEIEVM
ncbi:flagellar basal body P-ring protein FlgI [Phenylobacterium sp. VNQ135]|uniref:flagellar basal body P-ring protein FlgI n=1 Tax=Phenylobacterium sp. VNQ135 TaxID=3400922 RepID=UPI003C024571